MVPKPRNPIFKKDVPHKLTLRELLKPAKFLQQCPSLCLPDLWLLQFSFRIAHWHQMRVPCTLHLPHTSDLSWTFLSAHTHSVWNSSVLKLSTQTAVTFSTFCNLCLHSSTTDLSSFLIKPKIGTTKFPTQTMTARSRQVALCHIT